MLSESCRNRLTECFAKKLAACREAKGLSKRRLAEDSGVSLAMVSEIEGGKKTPSIDTIYRLARALDIRPGKLIDEAWREVCEN